MQPVVAAALVHVFTASGVVCALLATRATIHGQFQIAFAWLAVAFFIDGIDGYFARRQRVHHYLPNFSGETMDLVIDYITYVFIPALMLLEAKIVTGVPGLILTSLICMSSLYHFCDEGSKAQDNCFVGFPAIWNIVIFYFFAFGTGAGLATAVILACVGLTFVRLKWVHPLRVVALRHPTLAMTAIWSLAAAYSIYQGFPAAGWAQLILALVAIYGVGLSVYFGRVVSR
jgi:phosphatidylcholine synthase